MARTVASLAVEVLARVEKFEQGILHVVRRTGAMAADVENTTKKMVHAAETAIGAPAALAEKVSETAAKAIAAPFIAGAQSAAGFVAAANQTVTKLEELAETAERTGKKVAGAIGNTAEFLSKLPVGDAISSVLGKIGVVAATVVKVGVWVAVVATAMTLLQQKTLLCAIATNGVTLNVGKLIANLKLLGTAWTQAFTTGAVQQVLPYLGMVIGKLMIISGIAGGLLFLGMAASVESVNRQFADLLGKTTPLQDAFEKLGHAWRLWTDFVVGDFVNYVGTALNVVAAALVEVVQILRFANDATGGWLVTSISLVGWVVALATAWKMVLWILIPIKATWAFIASSAVFKPVIAAFNIMIAQLKTILMTKLGIGAATAFWVALTGVGVALVATAAITATAYYRTLSTNLNAATEATSTLNTQLVMSAERLRELNDAAKRMNVAAASPEETYQGKKDEIDAILNRREEAEKRLLKLKERQAATEERMKEAIRARDLNQARSLQKYISTLQEHVRKIGQEIAVIIEPTESAQLKQLETIRQDKMKALGIDKLIERVVSADEAYAKQVQTLNEQLALGRDKGGINFDEYQRGIEAAAKLFRETDPVTKARIDAEKKLAEAMKQSATAVMDSLKTPWQRYAEQSKLIDDLLAGGHIDGYAAADAKTKNAADLKATLDFADVRTPSELLANRLGDLARLTGEFGAAQMQTTRQLDKLAAELASAAGIGDLFDELHENRIASLAKAFDGIEALVNVGKLTENVAAELKEKAARKLLKDEETQKGPALVQRGTTEAYQRDQEVKREALHAQKQLEELKKIQEEAAKARREQEETRRVCERIAEHAAVLKQFVEAGV